MKKKLFSVLAISAILFASCSSDEPNSELIDEPNDRRVQFSSGITTTQTRVAGEDGNIWNSNDQIGIFMVDHATTVPNIDEGSNTNAQYSTMGNGPITTFKPSGAPFYYPVNGDKVDFIAYHPYQANIQDFTYKINLENQENQSNIDLMLAHNKIGYDKSKKNSVVLTFSHQLVKVIIKVVKGAGVPSIDGLIVTTQGMATIADFDLKGVKGITQIDRHQTITLRKVTNNEFEAILMPVAELNAERISFQIGMSSYAWLIKNNTVQGGGSITSLEAGKKYEFNITLAKSGFRAEEAIDIQGEGTIKSWDTQEADGTGK